MCPKDPSTEPGSHAVVASVPKRRSPTGRSSVSPTSPLVRRYEHWPRGDQLVEASASPRRSAVVLPEVVPGVDEDRVILRRRAPAARSASARVRSMTSAHTSSYATRCGRVRGAAAPPACTATPRARRDLRQARIHAAPSVVDQVGSCRARGARPRAPGVDTDDQVGMAVAERSTTRVRRDGSPRPRPRARDPP